MMDLAGPKLRTGAVELGTPIVSFQPERDERRWPIAPAQVLLHQAGTIAPTREQVDAVLPITGNLVLRARVEDEFRFQDSRRRRRLLRVWASTDLWLEQVAASGGQDATLKALLAEQGFAEPEEIAAAVLFLASENARHVTGADLPVDDGFPIT
jgi:hypothetical protein